MEVNAADLKAYNLADKKELAQAKDVKIKAVDGVVDIAAVYPDVKEPGTYVLTWKGATPLVINHLYSPGRRPRDIPAAVAAFKRKFEKQLEKLAPEELEQVLKEFSSQLGKTNVIHITPLEYAAISTSAGDIKAVFWYNVAPHTVNNYVSLAKEKYFDGTTFHRVIKGFMIQGGDPLGNTDRAGTGGPGYEINAEFSEKEHVKGVLSMARSEDPNSAGSQFFIIHERARHLDGKYSAFGQVIQGLDIVDKIAETPAGEGGAVKIGERPKINSIKILPATAEMYDLGK
jgi:peptidyl-prolyl cis-trans isomerase B (cyclophilin B)